MKTICVLLWKVFCNVWRPSQRCFRDLPIGNALIYMHQIRSTAMNLTYPQCLRTSLRHWRYFQLHGWRLWDVSETYQRQDKFMRGFWDISSSLRINETSMKHRVTLEAWSNLAQTFPYFTLCTWGIDHYFQEAWVVNHEDWIKIWYEYFLCKRKSSYLPKLKF